VQWFHRQPKILIPASPSVSKSDHRFQQNVPPLQRSAPIPRNFFRFLQSPHSSMHHTFPCNRLIFPSHTTHTTLAGTPPTENEIIGRVGSSIIKLPKHNDVRINGQYSFLPAEPSLFFFVPHLGRAISILIQAIPFFISYTYHIHAYYTHSSRSVTMHSSSTIITLAFYILPTPHITPRDVVDRFSTSFSYLPHSFLFYFSTYTTFPTLLVVDYVGALRGGFQIFGTLCRPYKPQPFPLFISLQHCLIFHTLNLVMLQQSSYNCSVSLPSSSPKA